MSDAPFDPAARWPQLREQLFAIIAWMIGRPLPAPLAEGKGLLTRAERALVLKWLQPLERMVRGFILYAAQVLPETGAPPPVRARRPDFGTLRGPTPPAADRPLVRKGFCVMNGYVSWCHDGRPDAEPIEHYSAWVLVERIDAVLGAIENPAPHIARIARRAGRKPETDRLGLPKPEQPPPKPEPRGISDRAYPYLVAELAELTALVAAQNTS